MQAEAGVRFELTRAGVEEASATYDLRLTLGPESYAGSARIEAGAGAVSFSWSPREPPSWCVTAVKAQLRTLWRDRGASGGYPRRVTRWRPAPAPVEGAS